MTCKSIFMKIVGMLSLPVEFDSTNLITKATCSSSTYTLQSIYTFKSKFERSVKTTRIC